MRSVIISAHVLRYCQIRSYEAHEKKIEALLATVVLKERHWWSEEGQPLPPTSPWSLHAGVRCIEKPSPLMIVQRSADLERGDGHEDA